MTPPLSTVVIHLLRGSADIRSMSHGPDDGPFNGSYPAPLRDRYLEITIRMPIERVGNHDLAGEMIRTLVDMLGREQLLDRVATYDASSKDMERQLLENHGVAMVERSALGATVRSVDDRTGAVDVKDDVFARSVDDRDVKRSEISDA